MQSSHLIFIVAVVVYLQEAPLIPEKFVCIRLFLDVVDEELDEHASLTLADDGVRQLGEIRGKRVSRYQDVPPGFFEHGPYNSHSGLCVNPMMLL